jgi:SAM-dependent methyltransferase
VAETEFDRFADDYENILGKQLRHFDDIDYFAEQKINIAKREVTKSPGRILEFGCGIGRNLKFLIRDFPESEIWACDVSGKSLEIAAKLNPSVTFFMTGDERGAAVKFDLILIANVFHHIPLEQREDAMKQIGELLGEGGEVFIFEHNPYNPVTRYLVRICPFDKGAVLVAPGEMNAMLLKEGLVICSKKYMLFFPAALRHLRPLERYLAHVPAGGQYYFHACRPA